MAISMHTQLIFNQKKSCLVKPSSLRMPTIYWFKYRSHIDVLKSAGVLYYGTCHKICLKFYKVQFCLNILRNSNFKNNFKKLGHNESVCN